MQVDINQVVLIIVSTAVLHNIAVDKKAEMPPTENLLNSNGIVDEPEAITHFVPSDDSVRTALINTFFIN